MKRLYKEVENTPSGRATLLNQVKHIRDQIETKICSMSDTLDAKLSVNQDKVQQIYGQINMKNCSMSDTLDARMTGDQNRVEHIHSQIETRIHYVSDTFDAKIANNQNIIGDLAQIIHSMSDGSTVTGQKLESRIGYLEGNLHAIQMLSKEENIKGLEAQVDEEIRKLGKEKHLTEVNIGTKRPDAVTIMEPELG
ncbi:ribosome production factor 1-like protein [Cricetulus griseus]|uniref:Ribosome production factor 1-like protein n=1 Tax=Cricetulus griseus TaxID=10029 RepID=A0A061IE03_CRIGR|nr:ribosome production factor 1-like protein [Cricetulus griseus]